MWEGVPPPHGAGSAMGRSPLPVFFNLKITRHLVFKFFSGLVVHSNELFVGVKQQVLGFRGRE